ncbi:MAG: ATP-grasp domain-containing protein [Gammaproteobacteria bacterium]|nr:ATP-grasp domain-containing protein [Gammaproteobacteria bacterium]
MPVHQLHDQHTGRRIFNHDILSCTHEDVAGNHLYSGRALGMTQPDDFIQIHPFLKREWPAIVSHYERIGLPHSQHVIWDVSPAQLKEYPDLEESLFFFGPAENRARTHLAWERVVTHVNDKNNFVALATHLRLDIPQTRCFHGKQWFAGIEYFPYPCYLKPAVSVAGKGIHRCANQSELIQALAYFDEDVPLQVQEEIDTNIFLNLQYEASEQAVGRLLATEQVLKGFTHQGNRHPAKYAPWDAVEPMAIWMWKKGMRGIFAFDVAVVENSGGPRFVAIECNPRYNGASYPSAIARRLLISQWIAKDFVCHYDRLADIDLSGIEYNPTTGSGVILVNWGTVLVGKLGVLIAGTSAQQNELERELLTRLL